VIRYALPLKIILGFFAAVSLLIILLGWRLTIGPIALDWAGAYLKTALSSKEENTTVDFKEAVLIWQQKDARIYSRASGIKVIFYDVKMINKNTNFTLNIPEAGVRFSGIALLRGLLAPTDVTVSGLAIDYTLDKDIWEKTDKRPFMTRLEVFIQSLQNSNSLLSQIAHQLLLPPRSSFMAGYLSQISLLNTAITVNDQLSGQKWEIPNGQLSIGRTDIGLNIRLFGDINMASTSIMPIDISVSFDNTKKEAVTSLDFSGLRPSAIAGKVKALSGLANLDIPAAGNIEFTIDQKFEIPRMAFNVSLGKGQINPANIYDVPLVVSAASLNGHILKSENSIILEEIYLQLGQTQIKGSGLLYGSMEKPGIAIKADIKDLPFLKLKTYWPGKFGKGAYNWIAKNIDTGTVHDGKLEVYIKPDMWPEKQEEDKAQAPKGEFPENAVTLKFDFKNISAHYLRPMPILTDISGQAELNLHTFHLKAQGGKIKNLAIKKADLLFSDIHLKGQGTAHITIELEGKLDEILRVIDHKPLGYPTKYGIKEGSITGEANAVLSLIFPLLKKVALKDVTFDVTADIEKLSILKLTDSLAIQDGQIHMFVDGKGITAEGNVILNGVKFSTNWQEKFNKSEEFPTQYTLNGLIEGAEWEQLNLPFDPYIEGPVEIDLDLYGQGGALVKGNGQFNLLNSKIIFAPLGWKKEKIKAAHVDFDLTFKGPKKISIRNVVLQSDDLQANFDIELVNDRVTRFFIPKLIMKDTDMMMLMEWNKSKKYYLSSITGKKFNASPLIEIMTATGDDEEKVNLPDFNLEAEISDVLAKNNVRVSHAKVSAIYRQQDFTHVLFTGKLDQDKDIKVTIAPKDENRRLKFTSNNAGEAMRGLGMFNLAVGGEMQLTADMVRHEFGISLGGKAHAKDFRIIDSPGLSKLLTEKKFLKAQVELKKKGLSFSEFDMDFRTYNGAMEISDAKARGPMLGITIDGTVDQAYDEMSLSGTIIPVDGINSFLSNIPIIGTILTGGKGQGIFAATYTINGSLKDPAVNINPLSVLAPGILRRIFSALGGKKKTLREQAEEGQKMAPMVPTEKKDDPSKHPK